MFDPRLGPPNLNFFGTGPTAWGAAGAPALGGSVVAKGGMLMTIWHLLFSLCFVIAVAGGLTSSPAEAMSFTQFVGALCGAAGGGICIVAMWHYMRRVFAWSQRTPEHSNLYAVWMYGSVVPWFAAALFTGRGLSYVVLRLLNY